MLGHLLIWYIIALVRKDNGLIDAAWGINYIILNFGAIYLRARNGGLEQNLDIRSSLVLFMSTLYAIRMFMYVIGRTKLGTEDRRFAEIRTNLADKPCVFYTATLIIWLNVTWQTAIYNMPFYIICMRSHEQPFVPVEYAGLAVWIFGFIVITIADC